MKPENLEWEHWREELSVGVDIIDHDHKEILDLIARLWRIHGTDSAGDAAVRDALETIAAYSERHFEREETMLEAVGYPFLEQHRLRHQTFRAFVESNAPGALSVEAGALFSYLVDWWVGHIATDDKFYRGFLQK